MLSYRAPTVGLLLLTACATSVERSASGTVLERVLFMEHAGVAPRAYLMVFETAHWESVNFDACRIAKGRLSIDEMTNLRELVMDPLLDSLETNSPCADGEFQLTRTTRFVCWENQPDSPFPLHDLVKLYEHSLPERAQGAISPNCEPRAPESPRPGS